MPHPLLPLLPAFFLAPFVAQPAHAHPQPDPAPESISARPAADTDDLIAILRRALSSRDPAEQELLLKGIRTLRDPSFAPLLAQLADAGSMAPSGVRTQAILALAECTPTGSIDLLLVRKLAPAEQSAVLAEALLTGVLKPQQADDLARWPDLQPGLFLSVQARLTMAGRGVDEPRLRQMTETQPPPLAAAAWLLLAQGAADSNERASALAQLLAMVTPVTPLEGAKPAVAVLDPPSARALMNMSGQWGLRRTGDFAERIGEIHGADTATRLDSVAALMQIEPSTSRTLTAWLQAQRDLSESGDRAGLLRLAAMAQRATLSSLSDTTAPNPQRNLLVIAERLCAQRDDLTRLIGSALRAVVANTDDAPSALDALVRTRHAPSMLWAMGPHRTAPALDAGPVRRAVLALCETESAPAAVEVALAAAKSLCTTDPDSATDALTIALRARHDTTAARIISAALQCGPALDPQTAARLSAIVEQSPAAGAAPKALAALLRLRTASPTPAGLSGLTDADELFLDRIARGSGQLPEASRVQAAWIVIRNRQKERLALTQILADVMP